MVVFVICIVILRMLLKSFVLHIYLHPSTSLKKKEFYFLYILKMFLRYKLNTRHVGHLAHLRKKTINKRICAKQ